MKKIIVCSILGSAVAFMSDVLPTVIVKSPNGPVTINLSDFDPAKHQMADPAEIPPMKPLGAAEQVALFGSSVQPTGWAMPDGSTLKLGEVVDEAHKRSGLSIDEWNKLPQDEREKLIADAVAEMVPPAQAGFKIGKNGKRGGASKFVIFDADNKIVGTEEYATEAAAQAMLEILIGQKAT